MRYREIGRRTDYGEGEGVTINISGNGILFTARHLLQPGNRVELSVAWPVKLDGKTSLRLVVQGRVVWSDGGKAALLVQRHEFRTQRTLSL